MMSSNGDIDVVTSVRTGIEFCAKKTFKWSIEGFEVLSENQSLLRSQNVSIPVEGSRELRASIWEFSVFMHHNRRLELQYSYREPSGSELEQKYIMRISSSGKEVYNSGLQVGSRKCSLGQVDNIPLINGALVLEITLEFYRDVGASTFLGYEWDILHPYPKQIELPEMLKTGRLSDIKIVSSDGMEFFAHKLILKAGSEVFEAMFNHDLIETESGVLNLNDMSGKAVKFLLHFLYTGKLLPISVNEDDEAGKNYATIEEVLYLASKYRFTEVMQYLDENMERFHNGKNTMRLAKLCKLYDLEKGKDFVVGKGFSEPLKEFVFSHI